VITENGVSAAKEQLMTTEQAVKDTFRVNFYSGYLDNVCKAISEGIERGHLLRLELHGQLRGANIEHWRRAACQDSLSCRCSKQQVQG